MRETGPLITDQDRTLLEPSIQIEIANIQKYLCQHGFNRQSSKHDGAVLSNPHQKIARTASSPSSFIQDKDNITGDQMCLAVNAKPLDIDDRDTITISDKFTVYNNPHGDHTDYENNPAPNQAYMDTHKRENSLQVNYQSYLQSHLPPKVRYSKVADSLTKQNSIIDDNYLKIHRCIHTGEKPYQCKICQQHFNQQKRIHTGEKLFQCDVCHKCFAQSSNLNQHKRLHTGEKPFQCDICQKCYTRSHILNRHKRLHSGEKPYQRDVYHKGFTHSN